MIRVLAPIVCAAMAGALALAAGASPAGALGAAALGAAGAWIGRAAVMRLRARAGAKALPRAPAANDASGGIRAVLDALPIGVVVIAPDRTIRLANRMAAEMFGLPSAGHLSASMLRSRRLIDRIEAALEDGEPGTIELSLSRAGDVHLRGHVRSLGPGEGVVVAIEDQTQARRAGELHRDFVANASHELNTPLAAMSGIIETLRGHARDDPEATDRFLGLLADQTRRMSRLVEDLLSLNRIELNERLPPRELQDLAAVVGEAVEALRPAAEAAGVRLAYDPPAEAQFVRGDRKELDQLFRNLVENAVRYGGSGAEVHVGPAPASEEHPGMVGIGVRDTGPGIPREHIPRLTERFYRVSAGRSREKGGTGLGLAIVKHVVNRHRGQLGIESRVGEGSVFTVWLPPADEAPRDGPSPPTAFSA